jgi:hypothetical protein
MSASTEDTFRRLCLRVADETDPHKIELLKQRLRLLLLNDEQRGEEEKTVPSSEGDAIPIKR